MSELQLPPHDDEAERRVLGAAMLGDECAATIASELERRHFYREGHKWAFAAIQSLVADEAPITPHTICDRLEREGVRKKVGSEENQPAEAFLVRCSRETASIHTADHWIEKLQETAQRRDILSAAESVQQKARSGASPDDLADELLEASASVTSREQRQTTYHADELGKQFFTQIEEWADPEVEPEHGLSTGFPSVDELFRFEDGTLIVLAARPGMGKSSLGVDMQNFLSVDLGVPSLFASLEMTADTVATRHIVSRAQVPENRMRRGDMSAQDWSRVTDAASHFKESPLVVEESSALSIPELRAKIKRQRVQQGIGIVFVDYLQLMRSGKTHDLREQEIASISRGLKSIAKDFEIPVVALAQLNRGVEKRQDKRPKLADLRESGAIEQDADVVAFLFREAVYDDDANEEWAELLVRKNRNGPPGDVPLTWDGPTMRFEDAKETHDARYMAN